MQVGIGFNCLMHTVDHFGNEGWFNCDQEIIWMCFVCLLAKQHTMLKWKDAVSGFPVSQGSAEPLDRWGGKTNYCLISYFLSNTSAKNCRNRIVYVNIIASQRSDVFWDTVYYFPPPEMDAKYCDERVCVFECLYVCLSSRISQKLYVKSSRNFHYVYAKVCIT